MSERSRSPSSPVFKDSDDEYDTKSMHSLSLDDSPKQRLAALSSLQPVEIPKPPRSPPIDTHATITASLASNAPLENENEHGSESDNGFKEEPLSPPHSPSPKHDVHDVTLSPVALGTTVGESRATETSSSLSSPQRTPVDGTKVVSPPPSAGVPLSVPVKDSDASSISSETQRKLRPDSVLLDIPKDSLILGVAVVDFNHAVGPRIEFSKGAIFSDEYLSTILPFLSLPDGAHLSEEDYSYFHIVPSTEGASTVFGISCNRQIAASDLLVKTVDITRSTVQKAVVVLASKPIFGPIRDKLGVVTRAFFNQRDFSETEIIVQFYEGLEGSLRTQLTESGLHMGTSLRELVHAFRHRTLVLLKALMLQRRLIFYGHPVEKLCTYQYSLVSLFPGLLQTLEDCGSPSLAARAPTLKQQEELRTSDRKSMMAYIGLPLDIFGKNSFFQPYLPLQQTELMAADSWLCGSTNSIVTQQKDVDLFVNIETSQIEFRAAHVERLVALTPADRKWIDDIVRDVNASWNDNDPTRPLGMQFKGSDDYLRIKFEEYISGALSSIKFYEYQAKNNKTVLMNPGEVNNGWEDFGPAWMFSFQNTTAYEVWNRITDPLLFDIVEPKHPCEEKPTVVGDIGLRLQEGITDLKIDQQLAPARETLSNALAVGSTGFFRAVEGVKGGINRLTAQRKESSNAGVSGAGAAPDVVSPASAAASAPTSPPLTEAKLRPLSLVSTRSAMSTTSTASSPAMDGTLPPTRPSIVSWGSGIGNFISSKASRFSVKGINLGGGSAQQSPNTETDEGRDKDRKPQVPSPPTDAGSGTETDGLQSPSTLEFQPRNLDDQPRTPVTPKPTTTAAAHSPPTQEEVGYAQ